MAARFDAGSFGEKCVSTMWRHIPESQLTELRSALPGVISGLDEARGKQGKGSIPMSNIKVAQG